MDPWKKMKRGSYMHLKHGVGNNVKNKMDR
jgi:hypothetical protein